MNSWFYAFYIILKAFCRWDVFSVRNISDVFYLVHVIKPIYSNAFLVLRTLHHTQSVLSLGCVFWALYCQDFALFAYVIMFSAQAHETSYLFVCISCFSQFTLHSQRSLSGVCGLCDILWRFWDCLRMFDVFSFAHMIIPIYPYAFVALRTLHNTQSVLSLGCVIYALYYQDCEVGRACCDVFCFVHMIISIYSYVFFALCTLHHSQSVLSLGCVICALYCQDSEVVRTCYDVFCFVRIVIPIILMHFLHCALYITLKASYRWRVLSVRYIVKIPRMFAHVVTCSASCAWWLSSIRMYSLLCTLYITPKAFSRWGVLSVSYILKIPKLFAHTVTCSALRAW